MNDLPDCGDVRDDDNVNRFASSKEGHSQSLVGRPYHAIGDIPIIVVRANPATSLDSVRIGAVVPRRQSAAVAGVPSRTGSATDGRRPARLAARFSRHFSRTS